MAGKGFTKEQVEKGQLALKIKSKAFGMLKNNGDVDLETLKNSEEAKRLAELGVDVDAKIAEMVKKAEKKLEKGIKSRQSKKKNVQSDTTISSDTIKQAVNECMQGQCDLLNNLISKVDSFNDVVSHIKDEISELKNLKEKMGSIDASNNDNLSEKILNLEKKIESLQKISDDVAGKVKDVVNPEIENIAKETINAILEMKKADGKQNNDEIIMSVKDAIKSEKYRDKFLDELREAIQEDPESFNYVADLINKCKMGDQEACNILQSDKNADFYKKITEIAEKVDRIVESRGNKESMDFGQEGEDNKQSSADRAEGNIEGNVGDNTMVERATEAMKVKSRYRNPLSKIIFGRA